MSKDIPAGKKTKPLSKKEKKRNEEKEKTRTYFL